MPEYPRIPNLAQPGTAHTPRTYSRVVGDGVASEVNIEHNLGTRATLVSMVDLADGMEVPVGMVQLTSHDANRLTIRHGYQVLGGGPWVDVPIPRNGWLVRVFA